MKETFFTKQKIITFYSKMEKHKIFQKNKDFLPNTILKIYVKILTLVKISNFASSFCFKTSSSGGKVDLKVEEKFEKKVLWRIATSAKIH